MNESIKQLVESLEQTGTGKNKLAVCEACNSVGEAVNSLEKQGFLATAKKAREFLIFEGSTDVESVDVSEFVEFVEQDDEPPPVKKPVVKRRTKK